MRSVTKVLAGMEDLAVGKGKQQQERAGQTIEVGMIDIPYPVTTEQELASLDIAKYTRASSGLLVFTYSASATAGIKSNVGAGYWVPELPKLHSLDNLPDATLNKDCICIHSGKPVFSTGTEWQYFDGTRV